MSSTLPDRVAQRLGELARILQTAPADKLQEAAERAAGELARLAGVHA